MTFKERLIKSLQARGFVAEENGKYVKLTKPGMRPLFVGKSGALRTGGCSSQSRSIGDPANQTQIYKQLLAETPCP